MPADFIKTKLLQDVKNIHEKTKSALVSSKFLSRSTSQQQKSPRFFECNKHRHLELRIVIIRSLIKKTPIRRKDRLQMKKLACPNSLFCYAVFCYLVKQIKMNGILILERLHT